MCIIFQPWKSINFYLVPARSSAALSWPKDMRLRLTHLQLALVVPRQWWRWCGRFIHPRGLLSLLLCWLPPSAVRVFAGLLPLNFVVTVFIWTSIDACPFVFVSSSCNCRLGCQGEYLFVTNIGCIGVPIPRFYKKLLILKTIFNL